MFEHPVDWCLSRISKGRALACYSALLALLWCVPTMAQTPTKDACLRQYRKATGVCDTPYHTGRRQCRKVLAQTRPACGQKLKKALAQCKQAAVTPQQCRQQSAVANASQKCKQTQSTKLQACGQAEQTQRCDNQFKTCKAGCKGDGLIPCVVQCQQKQVSCVRGSEDRSRQCRRLAIQQGLQCQRTSEDRAHKQSHDCIFRSAKGQVTCTRNAYDNKRQCVYRLYDTLQQCLRRLWDRRRSCYHRALKTYQACR